MNYYEILGVKKSATEDEIKSAYKTLVKKYHPDVYNGDKTFAEKKTQEINEAYDILSKKETREAYDDEISPKPVETTYEYTPPQYDNPRAYYEEKYRQKYGNYDPYKYRPTPNSSTTSTNYTYTSNLHDDITDKIIDSFDKTPVKIKLRIFIIALAIYLVVFGYAIFQIFEILHPSKDSVFNSKPTTHENQNYNIDIEEYDDDDYDDEYDDDYPEYYKDNPDFNLNLYVSDTDLYDMYELYHLENRFESFGDFKEYMAQFIYEQFLEYHRSE